MSRTCRTSRIGVTSGGGAVFVILLLLVAAGAACWYLFKPSPPPELPARETSVEANSVDVSVKSDAALGAESGAAPMSAVAVSSTGEPLPLTEAGEVDWAARHSELKKKAVEAFNEPKIGMNIKMRLSSGTIVQGRISDLTQDSIKVRVGSGHATYMRSQISPQSQVAIFKDAFVEYSSRKMLAEEMSAAGKGPE